MQKNISFKQGEEKREELELPTLHFVVMDQWLDVIGEKAFIAWLKFYTWCDRDRNKGDKLVDINLWEQSKVPYSFQQMIKKLGVGRDTFYNKIIKPLWNVGLIDIEEYEDSKNTGQKPMNIIVYKYPQNNKSLSFAKIKEIRNYDTDYSSTAKSFAKKGGRPKKEKSNDGNDLTVPVDNVDNHSLEGGSQIEQGGFSLGTGGGSQIGDNNIFNSISNSLNNFNNTLNDINNNFNSSSSKQPSGKNIYNNPTLGNNEEEEFEINPFVIQFLKNGLKYNDFIVSDIIKHMKLNKIHSFSKTEMENQARRIIKWVSENKQEIREFGMFFVNGILKHEPSRILLDQEATLQKIEQERKEQREIEEFIKLYYEKENKYPTQEEISQRNMTNYKKEDIFYNWLES